MNVLPGISGTLLPGSYLQEGLSLETAAAEAASMERLRRHLTRWWKGVTAACGPASGLRALFDLAAMPLFGMLGFRARNAVFDRGQARAILLTPSGRGVGLVLLPWAARPSALWRDLVATSHDIGASWCFLFAPPFLSLVDTRGHATRRSLEFMLPQVLEPPSTVPFLILTRSSAFEPDVRADTAVRTRIDRVVLAAARHQDRVRGDLQHGVVRALQALTHVVDARAPTSQFDEGLTLVFRILFLLFAESRDLVPCHDPIYEGAYAVGALCRNAVRDEPATGLWDGLAAVTRLSRHGCRTEDLVVRPFNGRLFARSAAPSLEARRPRRRSGPRTVERDRAMQRALVALGTRRGARGREEISYADLGVEQLGAVYERVLDLDAAAISADRGAPPPPVRRGAHSRRRKQSGTFYTPQPLAEFVVRRTLAPLVAGRSADAILALRVLDPAMGSGAFLVAACRFLASAYERALIEEGRRASADIDSDERAGIRRLVAERCLAGVDRNPRAVHLARLSLWLTTLSRGKPLGFLDHRLQVGNSLVGASPEDLAMIPVVARRPRRDLPLLQSEALEQAMRGIVRPLTELWNRRDDTVKDVRDKLEIWNWLTSEASPIQPWRLAATVWCARWFWPETAGPPSPGELRAILAAVLSGDPTLPASHLAERTSQALKAASEQAFFHWRLEFSDVFYTPAGVPSERAGFDAVIGNPPWEMLRDDPIADRADLHGDDDERDAAGGQRQLLRFIRESGIFPSCVRGHVNLYQPFLERALSLCRPGGRVGMVLPWGLAVDDGAEHLRRRLLAAGLGTVVGLDNAYGIFPIHRGLRFLVAVATPGAATTEIRARFGVKRLEDLNALPGREAAGESAYPIRLTPARIAAAGGRTLRLPDVRSPEDLERLERLARAFPALGAAGGWAARFGRELNATDDRGSFGGAGLPVIEGKHLAPFHVRLDAATKRIERRVALGRLPDGRFERPRLGYRDVSGVGNRLSLIAAVVPGGVVTTHTIFCLRSPASLPATHFLCGLFNSFVLNAVVRMLMGGHVTTSLVESLPVPLFDDSERIRRIARLAAAAARGVQPVALHARLQAETAALYGLSPGEFRLMLKGFPLVSAEERDAAARELDRIAGSGQSEAPG
jgi:hypothetical protein